MRKARSRGRYIPAGIEYLPASFRGARSLEKRREAVKKSCCSREVQSAIAIGHSSIPSIWLDAFPECSGLPLAILQLKLVREISFRGRIGLGVVNIHALGFHYH